MPMLIAMTIQQASKKQKTKRTSPQAWDQSICAESEAIQHQKPGSAVSEAPNAGGDSAKAGSQRDPGHKQRRASDRERTPRWGSIPREHKKVQGRQGRVENPTERQEPPVLDQCLEHVCTSGS